MELTAIDAVLVVLVVAGGIWGLVAGGVKVAGPLALLVAVLTLIHAYPELSTRFGAHPPVQFFLPLLVCFTGLVVYGFVGHILHGAVQLSRLGPLNRLLGLGLGLVTGTVLAGGAVWGLNTYGGIWGMLLLRNSAMAPVIADFFQVMMGFTQRLFPQPEPAKVPWWKRSLW